MPVFDRAPTIFDSLRRRFGISDPTEFYATFRRDIDHWAAEYEMDPDWSDAMAGGEAQLYLNRRPYYKVYPEFVPALGNTRLDVPAKYFKLPYTGWEIRLPLDTPVTGEEGPITSVIVYDLEKAAPSADSAKLLRRVWHQDYGRSLGVAEEDFHFVEAISYGPEPLDGSARQFVAYRTVMMHDRSVEESLASYGSRREGEGPDRELFRLVMSLSFLITGHDRVIEPDVLDRDLNRFCQAKTEQEILHLHDRATRRRNEGRGYTVGRRERLLALARERAREYEEGGGQELRFQHERCGHLHGYHTSQGYVVKWIPQLTVRPDLPVDPRVGRGVNLR